jgi:hypothetical protein
VGGGEEGGVWQILPISLPGSGRGAGRGVAFPPLDLDKLYLAASDRNRLYVVINVWLERSGGPVDAPTAVQYVRRADGQLGGQAFTLLVKKTDKNVILEPLHDGHDALAQVKDPRLLLSIDGHNCRSTVSP